MLIVLVHIQVKPAQVEAFKEACLDNICRSLKEPGIARFELSQQADDPCRFLLTEAYRDEAAPAAHKQTAHYLKWRDTVEPMMAAGRRSVKYLNVSPLDEDWR